MVLSASSTKLGSTTADLRWQAESDFGGLRVAKEAVAQDFRVRALLQEDERHCRSI